MKRTYYRRGRQVEVEQLADVVAVHTGGMVADAEASPAAAFGTPLAADEEDTPALSSQAADALRRAGWTFVRPGAGTADAAMASDAAAESEDLARVYVDDGGRTLLGTDRLTVRFKDELSEEEARARLDRERLQVLERLQFAPNLFQVKVPAGEDPLAVASRLSGQREAVLYAEPEMIEHVPGRLRPDDPDYGQQWQWHNLGQLGGVREADVRAEPAWETTRGNGIRIAVIDNGFDVEHEDLAPAIAPGSGFFRSSGSRPARFIASLTGFPDGDHGTFCAGMAGARGNNGKGVVGAAFESSLLLIACLADQVGTQTTLARAVAYAARPQTEGAAAGIDGADVIACSLGPNNASWALTSVLEDALNFAASQGREGKGTPIFWAVDNAPNPISRDEVSAHPLTISVGRSTRSDRENGSAFGPELDFLAPGVDVFSTNSGGGYGRSTGTSFAAPCAAGVAALVLAVKPDLKSEDLRKMMRDTCRKIGGVTYDPITGHHDKYGFGCIDAASAVTIALTGELPNDASEGDGTVPNAGAPLVVVALPPEPSGDCEWRTTAPTMHTITLRTNNRVREVQHSLIDGQAVFEGDILLSRGLEALGIGITGPGVRWPKGIVVYDLHENLSDAKRADVEAAIAHWTAATFEGKAVIKFTRRTPDQRDYVLFRPVPIGCSSAVGRIGGVQFVNLASGCSFGNIVHEIGHAIGLWHEQSREDRDKHVTILWDNVKPNDAHNFNQQINDGDDIGGYDFGSIMHYPTHAFAKDPAKPTIIAKSGAQIGQRLKLSDGDIAAVAAMYKGILV